MTTTTTSKDATMAEPLPTRTNPTETSRRVWVALGGDPAVWDAEHLTDADEKLHRVVTVLTTLLTNDGDQDDADAFIDEVAEVNTYAEAGVMTSNEGLVLRLDDGREYHVTVVESARSRHGLWS